MMPIDNVEASCPACNEGDAIPGNGERGCINSLVALAGLASEEVAGMGIGKNGKG